MNKKFAWIAGAVVALVAVVVPVTAANAATTQTLPAGISMYIIDQAGRGVYESDSAGKLTKTSAVLNDNFTDVQSGAYNYESKELWMVDTTSLHFGSINLDTGVLSDLGTVSYGSDSIQNAYGLDFADATHAKLLIWDATTNGGEGAWGIFDMSMSTGELTNPLWLTGFDANVLSIFGLGIDFAHGGGMYVDTSENSINLVNNDGTLGPNLADPASLDPAEPVLWDGKFDSNGVFWAMSADCCSLEMAGNIFTYKTGGTEWGFQGTTDLAVSGPIAVGYSTSKDLPDTGASVMLVVALSVSGVALVGIGIAGVMIARRRKA